MNPGLMTAKWRKSYWRTTCFIERRECGELGKMLLVFEVTDLVIDEDVVGQRTGARSCAVAVQVGDSMGDKYFLVEQQLAGVG